ncbi:MAG: Asp-tRNA(Asn)/Glu-tRNA(Gln) amidotransferase subunit GatC [Acidobacteria bacterium]|nr:Asp-tRNA(Asn)/Glu-tRNA(Gln) amidotransferase subunit GatC [Acidobacteriota bacterium]MBI3663112.1 Asp-tRNA(Asn)/Glu-tRNA(Gln) amidotransferase subunit GatC [Acidobacteriota bacterium]
MKITREQVLRVAELAHLELSEAELETYSRQLDSILAYIEKLNQLDTSQVEPMAQVFSGEAHTENASAREDVPRPSDVVSAVLDIAPDPSRPYFRVPKVIDR